MAIRVKHHGQCCYRRSTEEIDDSIGASLLIFNVQVELLQVGGPLLVAVIQ